MSVYRAEIFLWMIATSLPLIMMGVWVEAGSSGRFAGFTSVDAARYFIAVFIVRQLTICWVIHEFEWNVVSGKLSSLLLHPIDVAWRFVAMHIGEQVTRLPFGAVMVGLCFLVIPDALVGNADRPGWWLPAWWQVGLALLATYAAFTLRFAMQYTTALGAFWVERVSALDGLFYLPYLFLSGMIVPLQVLPAPVADAVLWTPFPYLLWFPAQLLAAPGDTMSPGEIARGFAMITGWIVVFITLNRLLWHRGLKHYSAMGA
ncbi:MAG: ABC-2 family transporter protein [Planctomycetota bacterium]